VAAIAGQGDRRAPGAPLAVVVPIGAPLSNRAIAGLVARFASATVPAMV